MRVAFDEEDDLLLRLELELELDPDLLHMSWHLQPMNGVTLALKRCFIISLPE